MGIALELGVRGGCRGHIDDTEYVALATLRIVTHEDFHLVFSTKL